MNYDSFLEIGSQHKVCEDSIASGIGSCPYVILSDGCSASENSNYGAMILVQLAKRYLFFKEYELTRIDYSQMGRWIIHKADAILAGLGLNPACLDATLIVSYSWNGIVYVYVYGDGYVIAKTLDGLFMVYDISFPSGFPYYLSYEADYSRKEGYKSSGHLRSVNHYLLNDGKNLSFRGSVPDLPLHYKFISGEVYIASDGINSFIRNGEKLSVKDVISGFLDMKKEDRNQGTKGVFVQRRCRKAIKGFRKEGWNHYDDISFGGFLCNTT